MRFGVSHFRRSRAGGRSWRRVAVAAWVFAGVLCVSGSSHARGELIRDVRVKGAARTEEETVRALAGVKVGEELEADTVADIKERLNNSNLFSHVDVYWEEHDDGVRIVITVKDKFPWAPVPTFTISPGETAAGAMLVHGNLFGQGKQGVVGFRISNLNSFAVLGYRDPSFLGTWLYYQVGAAFSERTLVEYSNERPYRGMLVRSSDTTSLGGELAAGVFWWRRVRTELRWHLQQVWYDGYKPGPSIADLGPAMLDDHVFRGALEARLQFDFRAIEHAVVSGRALTFQYQRGSPAFGSSRSLDYYKSGAGYEQGVRILKSHNWILRTGIGLSDRLPLMEEHNAGGTNLRGFRVQQFRGDTQVALSNEYHVPLVPSRWPFNIRALVFCDIQALWFRSLPAGYGPGVSQVGRGDANRSYLDPMYLRPGFRPLRDVHMGVGAGLRFYLKTVAVPLIGFDYGYGVGDNAWRMVLVIGT